MKMLNLGQRRKIIILILFLIFVCPIFVSPQNGDNSWIRINQLGYKISAVKIGALISRENVSIDEFEIRDALTDELFFKSNNISSYGKYLSFESAFRLNFSSFRKSGVYYVQAGGVKSGNFRIDDNIYNGTADYLLNYMRQQRCGYNPFLKDSCHTHDGFVIYSPGNDSTHINVTGGWHDASDYLQYVTTSANAVFQMLFAYQQNPNSFGDQFDADGNPGANNIPDILDEAKWGLDWLVKMNPSDGEMYNQIADDRDHQGFKLPTLDSISYGKELERPVYFCTGKPQGVLKYQNRSDGVASTAGKFASAFTLGSALLKEYYPEFSKQIKKKAESAYKFGKAYPGVCQTAPCRSPYFYEEGNYTDDMELAAVQLYLAHRNSEYLNDAIVFGESEPVTPWMGTDTARHYQWYPFVNLGHYYLASIDHKNKEKFVSFLRRGIEAVYQRGKDDLFKIGFPFIWCSNNLAAALLTQVRLYYQLTGDEKYSEMETAVRDWLFGCNPWGTSMIVGLPAFGDYPSDPHSAFRHTSGFQTWGGLVDGPVYSNIFESLIGLTLYNGDEYSAFQSDYVVYHDDYGDYSTNEPTMDGTASLTYYLSSLENNSKNKSTDRNIYHSGAVIRTDTSKKIISLVFTGHEFADGADSIIKILNKKRIKAAFFFTGDFYRNPNFDTIIKELIRSGHYLGAHSNKHLLYADWEKRDSTLVAHNEFTEDLRKNYYEMKKFGIMKENAKIFLPPFEWYNQEVAGWCEEIGIKLINYSPGTLSNADYTIPEMKNYRTSEEIYRSIIQYEKKNNLNGFILLQHIGTDSRRKDKFYFYLERLLNELIDRGYLFNKIDDIL